MTTKENCDRWIDYVYGEWLERWIRKIPANVYLRESTKNMVDRMKSSSLSGRTEEAWNLLERLKRLSDSFYGGEENRDQTYQHERSEVYMECALVAYKMGDLQEALSLFRISTDGFFRRSLHKAVSYWFYGCVQWQLPSHSESAVLSWERGMQIINDVGGIGGSSDSATKKKCDEVVVEMRKAINEATRLGFPQPPPALPGTKSKPAPSSMYSARLKFLPYFGSIPAGDPAVVDNHPDMVDVDALKIEGCSYKIYGVRKEREVRMKPSARYFLAKADGHSMNIAEPVNIEDEDYVLLYNTQQAQNNDIVAAVVFGQGELETATLKRYHLENGGRILRSESDREPITLTMSGKDYVQGVVVAILKCIND